jgi:GTP-binding protein
MKVTRAEFIGAATEPGRFPPAGRAEVAFAGRSNVGKSSAINRILGKRGLARTSSTPGRTQQLNFFAIDDRVVFVDLPGYGYAKVPKALRAGWGPLVESYLEGRAVLAGLVLLIDVRRGFEEEEQRLLDFAASRDLPLLVIATKVDKLRRGERDQAERAFATAQVPVVPFSALSGEGVDAVWRAIATWTATPARGR